MSDADGQAMDEFLDELIERVDECAGVHYRGDSAIGISLHTPDQIVAWIRDARAAWAEGNCGTDDEVAAENMSTTAASPRESGAGTGRHRTTTPRGGQVTGQIPRADLLQLVDSAIRDAYAIGNEAGSSGRFDLEQIEYLVDRVRSSVREVDR